MWYVMVSIMLVTMTVVCGGEQATNTSPSKHDFLDDVLEDEADEVCGEYHPVYPSSHTARESFIYAALRYMYVHVLAGFLNASERYPEYQKDLDACRDQLVGAVTQLAQGKITTVRAVMRIEAVAMRLIMIFTKVHKKKIGRLAIGCLLIGALLIDYYTNDARIVRFIRAGCRRIGTETMRLTMYIERVALRVLHRKQPQAAEYAT